MSLFFILLFLLFTLGIFLLLLALLNFFDFSLHEIPEDRLHRIFVLLLPLFVVEADFE